MSAGIAFETGTFTPEDLGIVDGPPDPAFDNLTALASSMVGAPVSLVSIVQPEKDRQFFTSQVGLAPPFDELRQTPLSHSFCKHVVSQDGVLQVDDARHHPVVSSNKAIDELGVIAYLGTPVHDQTGRPTGALCVIDGRPRAWTADEVATMERLAECVTDAIRLKAELLTSERLRSEMAEFTYALSHDLKAPSNTLHLLVEALRQELGGDTTAEATELVDMTLQTADRMRITIDAVLDYVQTVENRAELGLVDLDDVMAEVVADLKADVEASGAVVTVGPMPRLNGIEVQLRMLFQNLVSNALKFRAEGVVPLIDITAEHDAEASEIRVSVADNGIGIPANRQERIFGLFERLQSPTNSPYPGTGIGLTACRRIVENHGGRIEIESEVGAGTTFIVTLPTRSGDRPIR